MGEYKWNRKKFKKFCIEEKTEQGKFQLLQQSSSAANYNSLKTSPMGHAEVVALARKNQHYQKISIAPKQVKPTKQTTQTKYS